MKRRLLLVFCVLCLAGLIAGMARLASAQDGYPPAPVATATADAYPAPPTLTPAPTATAGGSPAATPLPSATAVVGCEPTNVTLQSINASCTSGSWPPWVGVAAGLILGGGTIYILFVSMRKETTP